MQILFTGGSSFTGYWFIKELIEDGHDVHAVFTKESANEYSGVRSQRVNKLKKICKTSFGIKFGDPAFIRLINDHEKWDLFCHHASYIKDYKEPGFDIHIALKENTNNISDTLDILKDKGCKEIILTGSYFENDEGESDDGQLEAFSPYGLSKNLTFQVFRYYCQRKGFKLGKFVIPNPFGPFEELRFTSYLVNAWSKNETPAIKTPDYIRDNIPVTLLAKSYVYFINKSFHDSLIIQRFNPSCYVESQGDFAKRFARNMKAYLQVETPIQCLLQTEFTEPLCRRNTLKVQDMFKDWNEEGFWKDLADYYKNNIL